MIAKWGHGRGFDFEVWVARMLLKIMDARGNHHDGESNKYRRTCCSGDNCAGNSKKGR